MAACRLVRDHRLHVPSLLPPRKIELGADLTSFSPSPDTAVMTYIILFIVDHIPGLKLRSTEETEILGIDETEVSRRAWPTPKRIER